jgi:hypothetical protein
MNRIPPGTKLFRFIWELLVMVWTVLPGTTALAISGTRSSGRGFLWLSRFPGHQA